MKPAPKGDPGTNFPKPDEELEKVIPDRENAIATQRFLDKQSVRIAWQDSLPATPLDVGNSHALETVLRPGDGAVLINVRRQKWCLVAATIRIGLHHEVVT